jgi:hypothetical protein
MSTKISPITPTTHHTAEAFTMGRHSLPTTAREIPLTLSQFNQAGVPAPTNPEVLVSDLFLGLMYHVGPEPTVTWEGSHVVITLDADQAVLLERELNPLTNP